MFYGLFSNVYNTVSRLKKNCFIATVPINKQKKIYINIATCLTTVYYIIRARVFCSFVRAGSLRATPVPELESPSPSPRSPFTAAAEKYPECTAVVLNYLFMTGEVKVLSARAHRVEGQKGRHVSHCPRGWNRRVVRRYRPQ